MAIVQNVWRFQCDPQPADIDPVVQVFTKEVTDVDGTTFEKLSMEPVTMLLSELTAAYAAKSLPKKVAEARTKAAAAKGPKPV